MILAISVHIQLELLRHKQTLVKSKLKSFQILASVCLCLSRVPAGWDWAALAVPDRLNRSQRSIFHKSSECHSDSGLVVWPEEHYSMQAGAILLYFLP